MYDESKNSNIMDALHCSKLRFTGNKSKIKFRVTYISVAIMLLNQLFVQYPLHNISL